MNCSCWSSHHSTDKINITSKHVSNIKEQNTTLLNILQVVKDLTNPMSMLSFVIHQ
jgi:hypothetical protein